MSHSHQQPTFVNEKGPVFRTAPRTSDTSEGGLETIIFEDLLARGWLAGDRHAYDRQPIPAKVAKPLPP